MADKIENRSARIIRLAEELSRQHSADPIQRLARALQQDRERRQKGLLGQLSTPALSYSLGKFAASQSKVVEKEKELLDRIDSLTKELSKTKQEKSEKEQKETQLQEALAEYQKQGEIKYLLGKVNKDAEKRIRSDDTFLLHFTPGQSHEAFIMSVDIRSSTELMLNAKTPEDFASFITGLCDKLTELVIDNGGILDKFTGDGVLAFFPTFYSGDDAGYRAILAATQAIDFFREHYKGHRRCFRVVIVDTGLGVGIDWGTVHFVNIGESLSVVGTPVVYACRISSAPAGTICVNQPAKEVLNNKYQANTTIEEMTLDIKGSGPVVAYKVRLKGDRIKIADLPWKMAPTTA